MSTAEVTLAVVAQKKKKKEQKESNIRWGQKGS